MFDEFFLFLDVVFKNIKEFIDEVDFCLIVIFCGYCIIILCGEMFLWVNDYVYFIIKKNWIDDLCWVVDCWQVVIKNVMIFGGILLSWVIVKLLENDYNVILVVKDWDCCKCFFDELFNILVINGDFSNFSFLVEEGFGNMDVFIVLMDNLEINIIVSFMVKNYGVYKIIVQVENKEYVYIFQNIGVDMLINKKLIVVNNIFCYICKGKVEVIISLYGVDVEVIEFVV